MEPKGFSWSSVNVLPHSLQRKRWRPLRCFPKRFVALPQVGQSGQLVALVAVAVLIMLLYYSNRLLLSKKTGRQIGFG
jgi:hypothetical protein